MEKKLIFVYETDGLSNARTRISLNQTNEVKTNSFTFLSLIEFWESEFLEPDLVILEDEGKYQVELVSSAIDIDEINIIILCDSLISMEGIIEKLKSAPKIITLDYKIGSNKSPENLPSIYRKIRERFKSTVVIGYTNFGRKKADKEFSAKSADELTRLLRENGESVIDKGGMNIDALTTILYDRIQVQNLKKELLISSSENSYLKKTIESQDSIIADKIKDYKESIGMRNLDRPIIGNSVPIRKIKFFIEKYAELDISVLILGEHGTGKELVARAIHRLSSRCSEIFVPVDCGAINPNLIESELFGYEIGAFTGATKRKIGQIENSDKGTLFLDEIGNLDLVSQQKLLRALQERRIKRVGGEEEIPVDFRLITATNKNLPKEVAAGRFMPDLYRRISSFFPKMPALRERKEDIPLLVDFIKKREKTSYSLTEGAIDYLKNLPWEGNIRELETMIRNMEAWFGGEKVTEKEVKALIASTNETDSIDESQTNNFDCSEAETFLDKVNSILENNPQFIKAGKVRLQDLAAAYELGLSRNSFYEKRVKYTPCINILLNEHPEKWSSIRSKKVKLTS